MNDASPTAPSRSLWREPLQHYAKWPTMAFSPSGALIAVGTGTRDDNNNSSGSLAVFDVRTGAFVQPASDDGWQINALTFGPDSQRLATSESLLCSSGPDQHRLRIIDPQTLIEHCQYAEPLELAPDQLAFSRDGSMVVGALRDLNGPATRAFAFDAGTGAERWRRPFDGIRELVLSPDSAVVAVLGPTGISILDARDKDKPPRQLPLPADTDTLNLAYSPDGRVIALGCRDGTVHVLDPGTGAALWSEQTVTVAGQRGAVAQISISADSRWLAVNSWVMQTHPMSMSGRLSVYDLEHGTLRFPAVDFGYPGFMQVSPALCDVVFSVPYGPTADPNTTPSESSVIDARTGTLRASAPGGLVNLAIAPDGAAIAITGDPFVELYASGLVVSSFTVDSKLAAMAISPAGTPLVAVADAGPAVTVLTAADGSLLARKPVPGAIADVVFANSGQAVVTGGGAGVRLFSVVGDQSWKADTFGPVNALAAAGPHGDWLATAAGRTVRLLSSADGHERWGTPNTHPQSVTRIAASFDGAWIATGCADRTTRILDAAAGTQKFSVTGDGKVRAIAFQPPRTVPGAANEDGGIVLAGTANEDGSIVLVDAATATERGRISRPVGCAHIAFGFDGTTLAAAWDDNTVSIYDISAAGTPPELLTFTVTAPVTALAVNPSDGSIAVSVADGTSVVARDPHSGIELIRLLHPAPVVDTAISADGALVATTCADNIVRVWRSGAAPPDQPPA
jgi:WD40 repeat protein